MMTLYRIEYRRWRASGGKVLMNNVFNSCVVSRTPWSAVARLRRSLGKKTSVEVQSIEEISKVDLNG